MSEREEINLSIDLPKVTETPDRIQVRCGETKCYVYEHGMHGSGAWAVWTSVGGGNVVSGGTNGYSKEQALSDAREHSRRHERRRLMYDQLQAALAEGGGQA